MGGGNIDGFTWQRIADKAALDRRCRKKAVEIELPIQIGIGLTESEVRGNLGTPTTQYLNMLIYDHEHQETVRDEPFTASNTVYVELRGGAVWTVKVRKTTSN
jgi:hypothetical protein